MKIKQKLLLAIKSKAPQCGAVFLTLRRLALAEVVRRQFVVRVQRVPAGQGLGLAGQAGSHCTGQEGQHAAYQRHQQEVDRTQHNQGFHDGSPIMYTHYRP